MRLDVLLESMDGIPNLSGARCVGEWKIFDNEHGSAELEEYALNLCGSCPVRAECAEWVDSLKPSKRPKGVIAGRIHKRKASA